MRFICLVLCLTLMAGALGAQDVGASTHFDMTGMPLWARDLRRGEIVAFGSFPFVYFFTNLGMDIYRSSQHDWDRRYAPWPFASAGAIDKTTEERVRSISIAATGAIVIALLDYGIVRYQRSQREREARLYPEGTPIIIRNPLEGGEPVLSGVPEEE
ncbi:MAG: hypothetical protein FWH12_09230 [Treponema sp.]|nr:hypothetical protein [Treponema sp.]